MKKSKIVAGILLIAMLFCFSACKEENNNSSEDDTAKKTVTVNIDNLGEKSAMSLEFTGDTLFDALNENKIIDGENGQYGYFVKSVCGIVADGSDGSFWVFKDAFGEMYPTSIDKTVVKNGDTVNIVREKY